MSENRTLNSRYTLEAEIGRGGMGVVYRAEDAQMRRVVAIKTLPSIMTHNQELMRRFNSEIQHASQLEHPNIARVYDVGEDAGTNYYVMQYIAGKSLRELLKEKGRLTLEEALPILEQVASALDYANSQGIVHRDIKPENILLNKTGNAYVVDFGIAKAAEGTRTTRGMLGTPEYMSPEQIRGEVVDGRSDQYSLAVVAYEMLTGQTPFKTEGDDPWAQIQKHLNENVVDPRQFGIILSGNAANSLFKSLNKSSVQRFEKCVDFISGLRDEINVADASDITSKRKYSFLKWLLIPAIVGIFIVFWMIWHNSKTYKSNIKPESAINREPITQLVYVDYSQRLSSLISSSIDGENKNRICWLGKLDRIDFDEGGRTMIPLISTDVKTIIFNNHIATIQDGSLINDKVNNRDDQLGDAYSTNANKVLYNGLIKNLSDGSVVDIRYMNKGDYLYPNVNSKYPGSIVWNQGGEVFVWPALSKSGNYVALCDDKNKMCIYNVSKKSIAVIGTAGLYGPQPQFSEDEKTIIYSDGNQIIKVGIDGSNPLKVISLSDTDDSYIEYINYNGNNIVYTENPYMTGFPSGNEYYLLNMISSSGNVTRQILKTKDRIRCPVLSPDESKISYCKLTETGYYHVYVCDLKTDKTIDLGRGISPVWVVSQQQLGQKISDSQKTLVKPPSGYEIDSNISADFDGDGSQEVAYCGTSLRKQPIIWITKNGKSVWESAFNGKSLEMHNLEMHNHGYFPEIFTSSDVTGDGKPELCCFFSAENYIGSSVQFKLLIFFRFNQGKYTNLNPIEDSNIQIMINKTSKSQPISIATFDMGGSYQQYKWNGNKFISAGQPIHSIDYTVEMESLRKSGYSEVHDYFKVPNK